MTSAEKAIIRKDIRGVTASKQLFLPLLLVPLVLAVLMPLTFVLLSHYMPDSEDAQRLIQLLRQMEDQAQQDQLLLKLIIDRMLPMFFIIIPIMSSSVMAGGAFVSEREQRTLETLLYGPLSLKAIFRAKVMAAFGLGMGVTAISFLLMLIGVQSAIYLTRGFFIWPGLSWLIILCLLSPALSLIAITLIVRVSAKAKNAVEAQQSAAFLVLPGVLLLGGQMSGLIMISPLMLLAVGAALALIAWLLIKHAMRRYTYERLLP